MIFKPDFQRILIAFVVFVHQTTGYEYCKGKWQDVFCLKEKGSVALQMMCHPEQIDQLGKVEMQMLMTRRIRDFILRKHNETRNATACGELVDGGGKPYPKAIRMAELAWDEELAYTALVHVKRCHLKHDHCHSTMRFPYSGQNLGYSWGRGRTDMSELILAIKNWHVEHKNVADAIAMVRSVYTKTETGHFTAMTNERTTRVGCAYSRCSRAGENKPYYHLTCNYDYTNLLDQILYTKGDNPASDCGFYDLTKSTEFSCLCNNLGKYYLEFSDGSNKKAVKRFNINKF